MIDPKLNEIPAKPSTGVEDVPENTGTGSRRPRAGLSIKDTIAGDTTLSVGGRGVDTSGTMAGAGAGAGMTNVSSAPAGSPAPEIVPGVRSSGTTVRGDSTSNQTPTVRLEDQTNRSEEILESSSSTTSTFGDLDSPQDHEISTRAYECWLERGCPHGSAEDDWHRAEQELRNRRLKAGSAAAGL
jgi:hypothetical protein